jgi:hypothetical protein
MKQAREFAAGGLWEEALEKQLWFHNHAFHEPALAGVWLSFALADWVSLGECYPPARQSMNHDPLQGESSCPMKPNRSVASAFWRIARTFRFGWVSLSPEIMRFAR